MTASPNHRVASRDLCNQPAGATIIRRWALVRLILGFAQMFGAVFSVGLIVHNGITSLALASVIVTGMSTGISMSLFQVWKRGQLSAGQSAGVIGPDESRHAAPLPRRMMPTRELVKITNCVQSVARPTLCAALFAAIALCSCDDNTNRNSHIQDRVNAVRENTIPSDAILAENSRSTFSAYLATADWEFETSEDGRVYLSWISQQLEHDRFKLRSSNELGLVLTKNSGAEAEALKVQITRSNGMSHVQITYTIDSD